MSSRYATERRLNEVISKAAVGAGIVGLLFLLVIAVL